MWVTGVFPWRQSELRANFSSAPADVNCCSSQMHCSLLLGFSERLLVRATSSHNDLKCKYMNHWLILLSNEYNHLHIWTCALDMYVMMRCSPWIWKTLHIYLCHIFILQNIPQQNTHRSHQQIQASCKNMIKKK